MDKPKKLNEWFYMVMKEVRRNGYLDLADDWDISEEEVYEVHDYLEEKLDIKL